MGAYLLIYWHWSRQLYRDRCKRNAQGSSETWYSFSLSHNVNVFSHFHGNFPITIIFFLVFSCFLPGNFDLAVASHQISHQISQYLNKILLKYSDGCKIVRMISPSPDLQIIQVSTGLVFVLTYSLRKLENNPEKGWNVQAENRDRIVMAVLEEDGTWESEGVLVRGDLGGGGEVCVGKGLDLEELSGGAERLERTRGGLGELFNCLLKQGLLTLLTTLPRASPSSLSTRGTAYTHIPAAPGNLSLSI